LNIEIDKISIGQFAVLLSPNFDGSYTAVRDDFLLRSFIFCKCITPFMFMAKKNSEPAEQSFRILYSVRS
jgi:hypothetical protein